VTGDPTPITRGKKTKPDVVTSVVTMKENDANVGWRRYKGKTFYKEQWLDDGTLKVLKTWKRKRPAELPPIKR
jgi:hypothetical protein